MNVHIPSAILFEQTNPFKSNQIRCASNNSNNSNKICTRIDKKTGKTIDVDTFISRNFTPGAQKNIFGTDIIKMSLNTANPVKTSLSLNISSIYQKSGIETSLSDNDISALVKEVLAEKGIGLNINTSA